MPPKQQPPLPPPLPPPTGTAAAATGSPTPYRIFDASSWTADGLRSVLQSNGAVGVHFQMVDDLHAAAVPAGTRPRRLAAIALAWAKAPPMVISYKHSVDPFLTLLRVLLQERGHVKVVYGVREAAHWLATRDLRIDPAVLECLDLQLYYEHVVDNKVRDASLPQIASKTSVDPSKVSFKNVVRKDHTNYEEAMAWRQWPPAQHVVTPIVGQAQAYVECYEKGIAGSLSWVALRGVKEMSARRWSYATKHGHNAIVWFDIDNNYTPRSIECLGSEETVAAQIPVLDLQCEIDSVLTVLPPRYRQVITNIDNYREKLVDVCLDIGRVPHAYVGPGQRIVLDSSRFQAPAAAAASSLAKLTKLLTVSDDSEPNVPPGMVSPSEIKYILEQLGGESKIGGDNRAGIDRQLHRISVMRSKTSEIYGLTLRVGRTLQFASNYLLDLLMSPEHRNKSVLLLGRPGSGKTTLIRDIARCVSERGENVCIIDTSNEIGGDGLMPHECIGWARRMMVKSLDEQASVMIECVQNHTVETLIVDEIGRKAEVNAAGTVRQRGPRLIASAHGDFRSLIKNQDLKGLIGGVQSVTVGDEAAKKNALGKVQAKRAGNPIFDVIVEIDEVVKGQCRIIWDVGQAVDDVLSGNTQYKVETRFQTFGMRGVQVLSQR